MLRELHIENYAIIESLDIEFSPSLNIITGETGAGKSILLGALGLLSGARADSSAILSGQSKCVVEGIFAIEGYGLESLFEELELEYQSEIAIRRVVQSSGKSRAFVGDYPVTLQVLKQISDQLIDIHSQHQTLQLSKGDFQCKILDAAARNSELLIEYRGVFEELQSLRREIERRTKAQNEANSHLDFLTFQAEQLSEANVKVGEQQALEQEQSELSYAEEVSVSFGSAAESLSSDQGGALSIIKSTQSTIEKIVSKYPQAAEVSQRIKSCYIELKDIAEELSDRALSIEANPRRLEEIEERLDIIYTLTRKHNCQSGDELPELLSSIEEQLLAIEGGGDAIEEMEVKAAELYSVAVKLASELSEKRKGAIPAIEQSVVEDLRALGIKTPNFKVQLGTQDTLLSSGINTIEFLFTANAVSELQPIGAVASGGEMSRLMLSIKRLVAREIKLPTIIFDEIDTGVSGVVADAMGEIIEEMSRSMQVVNITHLPQVAAKGDDHYEVYKDSGTHIRKLEREERVERIAAMLSGATITDAARSQAKELLLTKNK